MGQNPTHHGHLSNTQPSRPRRWASHEQNSSAAHRLSGEPSFGVFPDRPHPALCCGGGIHGLVTTAPGRPHRAGGELRRLPGLGHLFHCRTTTEEPQSAGAGSRTMSGVADRTVAPPWLLAGTRMGLGSPDASTHQKTSLSPGPRRLTAVAKSR